MLSCLNIQSKMSFFSTITSKIQTLEQLPATLERWRQAGDRVVFTNGCFDLLHAGHVEARKNLGVVVQAEARLPKDERPELWLVGADAGALAGLQRMARAESVKMAAWSP